MVFSSPVTFPSLLYDALERDRKRLLETQSQRRRLGQSGTVSEKDKDIDALSPKFEVLDPDGQPSSLEYEVFLSEVTPRELKYVIGFKNSELVSMSS